VYIAYMLLKTTEPKSKTDERTIKALRQIINKYAEGWGLK
jgi:hypothetical protein